MHGIAWVSTCALPHLPCPGLQQRALPRRAAAAKRRSGDSGLKGRLGSRANGYAYDRNDLLRWAWWTQLVAPAMWHGCKLLASQLQAMTQGMNRTWTVSLAAVTPAALMISVVCNSVGLGSTCGWVGEQRGFSGCLSDNMFQLILCYIGAHATAGSRQDR